MDMKSTMNKMRMSLDEIIAMEKGSTLDEMPDHRTKDKNKNRFGRKGNNSLNNSRNEKINSFTHQENNANNSHYRSFDFGNKLVHGSNSRNMGKGITITNLAHSVSDTDIAQLFGEFGQIVKAAIHFDAQGCHLGSASVIFAHEAAARNAVQKYNGVSLDRSPMIIQLNQSGQSTSLSQRLSFTNNAGVEKFNPEPSNWLGCNNESNNTSFALEKGTKSKYSKSQNHAKRKKESSPDPDKLDDELEKYMKKKKKKSKQLLDLELMKLKKQMKMKKSKSEDSSISPNSESNDTLFQKEIDLELDIELEKVKASENQAHKTEQEAEKIQKKLMSLI